jgi:hypothetical protein
VILPRRSHIGPAAGLETTADQLFPQYC